MTTDTTSSVTPTLAAGFPAYPDFGDNLMFIVVGFAFVVLVLLALAGVTSAIGAGITRATKKTDAKAPPPAARPAAPAPTSAEAELFAGHSNPEHVPAILAAAVHTALQGRKHRIKGVRIASGRWAQEGRRDIFSSHKVR